VYYYGARYYDPRISIFVSVDPLAESTMTPYQYVHNNPIMFTDPTGMSAEPPPGGVEGDLWSDQDGSWKFSEGIWKDVTGAGNDMYSDYLSEVNLSIDKKPSKLSADLTNAYSASGIRYGVEWAKNNISFGIYDFFHNNSAVTGYGSGEYGAYIPDGIGLSGGGSIGGFSASFSLVFNEKNQAGLFYSFDGTLKVHNIFSKPFGLSGTFDFYDNNGKSGNIFNRIEGRSTTISGGVGVSAAFSYPILENGSRDYSGVTKTSFGLGSPSIGYGSGYTKRLF